jgi:hypothetical protein
MKTLERLQFVLIPALIFSAALTAKCPAGSVTVHGRVKNLPSAVTDAEATVVLGMPKGTVSRTASLSNGEFTVEAPFSTASSHFMGGDRCNTVPKFVVVEIVSAGKVYAQRKIPFKDAFEMSGSSSHFYRLKQDLSIDVLKESGNNVK